MGKRKNTENVGELYESSKNKKITAVQAVILEKINSHLDGAFRLALRAY